MLKDSRDLALIINSKVPLIRLESFEEERALQLLTRVGISQSLPLYCWSVTEGLQRLGFGLEVGNQQHQEPDEVLEHIKKSRQPSLFVLCDFHPYLHNTPKISRLLKDIAMRHATTPHTVVLLSHSIELPPELNRFSAYFKLSLPDDADIQKLIRAEAKHWSKQNPGSRVRSDNATMRKLVSNLRGMTNEDTKRLIRGVIYDDGAITEEDIPELNKAKFELMDMQGVLSFEYDTEKFSDVGGLNNLKKWLQQRQQAFLNQQEATIDAPRGILLLGIQGGGKSLAAKAVAGLWGLPLLRLDFGALYNKFIGESEKNLREALQQAGLMSPCVLWLDELEKGLANSDSDDGVSRRILGTLLTWMSEHKDPVFLVATSNDISALPAELVRKGRFDEIFFVDLPDHEVRRDIFNIHLQRRQLPLDRFDLEALSELSEGFTGAEIEQAVVSGLYSAAARQQPLDTDLLSHELISTNPLSVTMAEPIAKLRHWAEERTVIA
ncbi:SpoVK/Ycf46/Vps4 family AAA+-type ATPase [Sinobacterium caligoides]|uniref:Uncharacterized AAA domain-containing protein ycf46 n=1 Tax=Sinobacterium caligoides TaxID=933926 RepID=A0A3N2DNH0_9GAMM|nr:AAA family ATPase [Sinobacterium caligoides]ROS01232.1 SpoVK/Ycf46/Vps4 family AAA+-type ATPase [Sinobacterium caligoides]